MRNIPQVQPRIAITKTKNDGKKLSDQRLEVTPRGCYNNRVQIRDELDLYFLDIGYELWTIVLYSLWSVVRYLPTCINLYWLSPIEALL